MRRAVDSLELAREESEPRSLHEAWKEERSAYEGLLQLRTREFNIAQSQSQSSSSSASQRNRQQQIDQLRLDNEENRYQSESQPDSTQANVEREMRQVMNRLEELARRQEDLNEQIRETELALREAKTEDQKREVEEELRRLRDSQQEMVRDADELLERMNREPNQESMRESRERMEQAREQMQQSSQALNEQQPASAESPGARAQQTMEETRDSLRQQSAEGLRQGLRNLLQQASELERQQQRLEQQIPNASSSFPPSDSSPSESGSSILRPKQDDTGSNPQADGWKEQRQDLEQLLDQLKETVTESETGEPVLAEELYDTYREAKRSGIGERLDQIPQFLERGMDDPARQASELASEGIRSLRERIEASSESVLGTEQESLRRALKELDQARAQIEQEMTDRTAEGPSDQGSPSTGVQRIGNATESVAPLTGDDFHRWTDAIREVEELVRDPDLKAEATRIREAARDMRIEYVRHAKEPQWPLVRQLIAEPMDALRTKISQDLVRKAAEKNQIVPMDRDPVPNQYQRQLDRYFENLGAGNSP
jgi:hypothetical protein